MSVLVKGGLAFLDGAFVQRDVLLDGGVIAAVGHGLKAEAGERVDASGCLVLPGLIDPHVHLREPGDTYKEDFATGTRAALAGGFTTVMDMPNNKLPTVTKARLDEKLRLAAAKAVCDVLFHFGGTDDNFAEVKKADPQSMKLYLGKTTGELMLKKTGSLQKHFADFARDRPIVLHACGDDADEEKGLERTYANIADCVSLASKTGRRIHLAHASTGHEIVLAKKWKGCTVEVAPHHLFLSSKALERLGPYGKVYPQLRSESKRVALWDALWGVDCIATDHAPHTVEDKEAGAAGFPGLETCFSLMLDACSKGLLDREWVAQRMTENVASAFGLAGRGRLEKGCIGDVTIADPRAEWKVRGYELETKCKWSPFDGMVLKGRVRTVIKSGKQVYVENEFWD